MKVNAMAYAKLLGYLMEGTLSCRELAEATGLHVLTVYQYTKAMHKEKVVHVCAWEGEGRNQTRIYMLGRGKDVPRHSKGRDRIHADYRARVKQRKLNHLLAGEINK